MFTIDKKNFSIANESRLLYDPGGILIKSNVEEFIKLVDFGDIGLTTFTFFRVQ